MPRCGLGTEHPVAPLDDVAVQLEDAPLRQDRLQHHGDDGFLGFAHDAALVRQKQVLGKLLADGRAPGHDPSTAEILLQRRLHPVPVKSVVIQKLGVLCCNQRPLQVGRDLRVVDPAVVDRRGAVVLAHFIEPQVHEGRLAGRTVAPPHETDRDPAMPQDHQQGRDAKQAHRQPSG